MCHLACPGWHQVASYDTIRSIVNPYAREMNAMTGNGHFPLSKIKVLDLTRARAGPTAVRQLVDWGGGCHQD